WTDLPGGVPDADDTPGACMALMNLSVDHEKWKRVGISNSFLDVISRTVFLRDMPEFRLPVELGMSWLFQLQNGNGGWPTFCRGWGNLPFDRSGADLTAHAIRSLAPWEFEQGLTVWNWVTRAQRATARGRAYLSQSQRPDGSWLPLWFGNQHA